MKRLFILICFTIAVAAETATAGSSASAVRKGNSAASKGRYDDALAEYEKALVDRPESPEIIFNKGVALYMKGDFEQATRMFEQASVKTRDPALEAKAMYNLGNTAFSEGERQKGSDLGKAIDAYKKSIGRYQSALKIEPGMKNAAENIEITRQILKNMLDELKKQQDQAQQQQAQQQQAAEELKKLIAKQEKAAADSKDLAGQQQQAGDTQEMRDKATDLSGKQTDIRSETGKLAEQMKQAASSGGQGKQNQGLDEAGARIKDALDKQSGAADSLAQNDPAGAAPAQDQAASDLKAALDAMSDKKQQQGSRQQQKQDDKNAAQQQQQQQEQQAAEQKDDAAQPQQNQQQVELDEDARQLIDEESADRKDRNTVMQGAYQDVDKDW